jgi:hypothetical protein
MKPRHQTPRKSKETDGQLRYCTQCHGKTSHCIYGQYAKQVDNVTDEEHAYKWMKTTRLKDRNTGTNHNNTSASPEHQIASGQSHAYYEGFNLYIVQVSK